MFMSHLEELFLTKSFRTKQRGSQSLVWNYIFYKNPVLLTKGCHYNIETLINISNKNKYAIVKTTSEKCIKDSTHVECAVSKDGWRWHYAGHGNPTRTLRIRVWRPTFNMKPLCAKIKSPLVINEPLLLWDVTKNSGNRKTSIKNVEEEPRSIDGMPLCPVSAFKLRKKPILALTSCF